MKQGGVKSKNPFSIDSIIASDRITAEVPSPTPTVDRRAPQPQLPLHPNSISGDSRLPDPSVLHARTSAVTGPICDEREEMRRRSIFDFGARYSNYDHAVAQFAAAAAAAMTTATPAGNAMSSEPLNYAYWMHANRQHASPGLFLPGKHGNMVNMVCLWFSG